MAPSVLRRWSSWNLSSAAVSSADSFCSSIRHGESSDAMYWTQYQFSLMARVWPGMNTGRDYALIGPPGVAWVSLPGAIANSTSRQPLQLATHRMHGVVANPQSPQRHAWMLCQSTVN